MRVERVVSYYITHNPTENVECMSYVYLFC